MLVFIDESGVHKTTDHTSIALVYLTVDNYEVLERTVIAIEKSLKISTFHWSETAWPIKSQFLDAVLRLNFQVKIAIINNPSPLTKNFDTILSHMIVETNIRTIYIDGKKSRKYERSLKKVLRDKGVSVRKLRTVKDSQFAGIRVADMIAGLARTVVDGKNLVRLQPYYDRLQKKILVTLTI